MCNPSSLLVVYLLRVCYNRANIEVENNSTKFSSTQIVRNLIIVRNDRQNSVAFQLNIFLKMGSTLGTNAE